MTAIRDEAYFHQALNAAPGDSAARFLLAECLAQRGGPRAAGYAWMALRGFAPDLWEGECWPWVWLDGEAVIDGLTAALPVSLFERLEERGESNGEPVAWGFPTRRAADDALADAFAAADLAQPPAAG